MLCLSNHHSTALYNRNCTPAVVEAAPAPAEAPTPALAIFELYTIPPGSLAVDGADRGRTPAKLELEPGTYTLTVTEPGFEAWTETVELAPGASRRVDIQLVRAIEKTPPRKPATARAVPDKATPVAAAETPTEAQPPSEPAAEAVPRIGTPRSSTLLPTDSPGRKLLPVK